MIRALAIFLLHAGVRGPNELAVASKNPLVDLSNLSMKFRCNSRKIRGSVDITLL